MKQLTLALLISITASSQVFAQNLIIDTKGIDQEKYSADMFQCEQLSDQVQEQNIEGAGKTTFKHVGRTAALGAGAAAIGGGSGTKGAEIGAGIGLVTGVLGHSSEKQQAQNNYENQKELVMRNCMTERGYTILN